MKITEILSILFAVITGGCLASIQLRRVIKHELPLFGINSLIEAGKINLDQFDKRMLKIAAIAFILFIVFTLIHYR
jgi:hypothetical protein